MAEPGKIRALIRESWPFVLFFASFGSMAGWGIYSLIMIEPPSPRPIPLPTQPAHLRPGECKVIAILETRIAVLTAENLSLKLAIDRIRRHQGESE